MGEKLEPKLIVLMIFNSDFQVIDRHFGPSGYSFEKSFHVLKIRLSIKFQTKIK